MWRQRHTSAPLPSPTPVTGQEQTIEDVTAYGQQHGFSNDMLSTTVNGFLNGYYQQIAQSGGIKVALEGLLNDLLGDSLPIDNITVEKLVDVGLPLLLPGADSGRRFIMIPTRAASWSSKRSRSSTSTWSFRLPRSSRPSMNCWRRSTTRF